MPKRRIWSARDVVANTVSPIGDYASDAPIAVGDMRNVNPPTVPGAYGEPVSVAMTTPVKRKGQRKQGRVDLKIAGRRALVTGSTSGIGYAIAEGLARRGRRLS